jgi:hypothetical protein
MNLKILTKKLAALGLALAMALSLTACGGGLTTNDAKAYIQGIMDMTYLGQYNAEYLQLVGSTEAECEENYLTGLAVEADYFAYYFDSYLTDAVKDEVIQLYKEIYAHSSYTVKDAARTSDGGFNVTVEVYPMDILDQVVNGDALWAFIDDFNARYEAGAFDGMSEDEYEAEWLSGVVEIIRPYLDSIGYLDVTSIVVQIQADEDGVFSLNEDDFSNLDMLLIDYPAIS